MEKVSEVNRSREWFDTPELYGWMRRAAFKAEGFSEASALQVDDFQRPASHGLPVFRRVQAVAVLPIRAALAGGVT